MLPTIGDTSDEALADLKNYVDAVVREADENRTPYLEMAAINRVVYVEGEQFPSGKVTVNEIGNAIRASINIMTKEPPRSELKPTETGEPATIFWCGNEPTAQLLVDSGMLPVQFVQTWPETDPNTGEITLQSPLPIPQDTYDALLAVPTIKPEWFFELTDETLAQTYQIYHDLLWNRSAMDLEIRTAMLRNAIDGFAHSLYWFDVSEMRHNLIALSPSQVFFDSSGVEQVSKCSYAAVAMVLDENQARRMYPELAQAIEEHSHTGSPDRFVGTSSMGAADISYRRPMISMQICWIRNQAIKMTPDDALAAGIINLDQFQKMTSPPLQPIPGLEGAESAPLPELPNRYALREVVLINNTIVADRECKYRDIPLLHIVNIPVPFAMYGLGDPYNLKGLQDAMNELLRAEFAHCQHYQSPPAAISQSMRDSLDRRFKTAWTKPGTMFTIPDAIYASLNGKFNLFAQVPELPVSLANLGQRLEAKINQQSGHAEVLQGTASAAWGHQTVEALQQAAASTIGFKSQSTADMLVYLTNLMLHAELSFPTPGQISRILSKFPPNVLMAVISRGKSVEWDITAIITTGSGQVIAQKKQAAMQDLQVGAITMQTYREKAGIDNNLEQRRQKQALEFQSKLAASQPVLNQPTQQSQGAKDGGSNSTSNGRVGGGSGPGGAGGAAA